MTPDALLELFDAAARAVRDAVTGIQLHALRDRTGRPGQYALDVVADRAVLGVLADAPVRIVSEESAFHDHAGASITVVVDPVDGSTNCARGISYWATSICAVDGEGPLAALVVNQATGARTTAVRGRGAYRDGVRLRAASTARVEDSVIALGGWPARPLGWKQSRMLGSIALELVDVAAGGLDGHVDAGRFTAPWDYLGGLLACREAGAVVCDANGDELAVTDPNARRQIVAAATPALLDTLRTAVVP
jgi:myo-inositol-1(or 4)-monophosphatase